jgi:putative ABC transport system ATP-binding protein
LIAMPLLETVDLSKTYWQGEQKVEALRGVSVSIERGEFICIMGPSGSGKSTLLHLIGGLDRPSGGVVRVEGVAYNDYSDGALSRFRRTRLGFIFQFFNLLPTLTALENVGLPLLLDGRSMAQVAPKARDLLGSIGLGHRVEHYPHQLSGGEMQRVAVARALVSDPLLVLADEPTGNLDTKTGTSILELLQKTVRERGQTLVMVTHDPRAAAYGTRVVHVQDGLIAPEAGPQ